MAATLTLYNGLGAIFTIMSLCFNSHLIIVVVWSTAACAFVVVVVFGGGSTSFTVVHTWTAVTLLSCLYV